MDRVRLTRLRLVSGAQGPWSGLCTVNSAMNQSQSQTSKTDSKTSEGLGVNALFNQYIDVVNRAFGQNRDGVYGQYMKLWDKAVGDEPIAVGVYDEDADNPHHWYTVKFSGGTFDIIDQSKRDDAKSKWKLDEDHLRNVVDEPKTYVEHPLKLDFDWMKTRLGLKN